MLSGLLSGNWIFLVNVPVGVAVWVAARRVLPADGTVATRSGLDVFGAITVTAALMLVVYAIVGGNEAGWTSARTLGLLAGGIGLLVASVAREARIPNPLVPLRLFTLRNVVVSQVVGVFWAAAMFAWFFLAAIYLQKVLHYDALDVGLAFVPTSVVMAYCSLPVSDRLVMRFGIRPHLTAGLLLAAASLALFSLAPVDGSVLVDVLPSMLLLGALIGGTLLRPKPMTGMDSPEAPIDAEPVPA